MTKSDVFFIPADQSEGLKTLIEKFRRLVKASCLIESLNPADTVIIKIHFGEEGNTGYVKPEYSKALSDEIKSKKAKVFLSDTNTLYCGRRTNSQDHKKIAYEHGFTPETTGTEVIIPDDTQSNEICEVPVGGKFIKTAYIASLYHRAEAIAAVSHFKGHIMNGFGGALKNIGMGCASREGKLAQHSDVAPIIRVENCIACKACISVCPVKAISLTDKKARLDPKKCIGCASCIAACKYHAIDVDWSSGEGTIQQKMVEYAKAVLSSPGQKRMFFNFVMKITKECDCLAKDDPRIAPDVGILASHDPVSIDQASKDLVIDCSGEDVFKAVHPNRDGDIQLQYAQELGIGIRNYRLMTVD